MSLTKCLSPGTESTIKTYATFLCITIIMYVFQLDTVIFLHLLEQKSYPNQHLNLSTKYHIEQKGNDILVM